MCDNIGESHHKNYSTLELCISSAKNFERMIPHLCFVAFVEMNNAQFEYCSLYKGEQTHGFLSLECFKFVGLPTLWGPTPARKVTEVAGPWC